VNPQDITLPIDEWLRPLPAPERTSHATIYRDVDVASVPGFRGLTLDLYLPRSEKSVHPLIVFIHGGAFLFGIRKEHSPQLRDLQPGPFERLCALGFAVASVEYRLSGEAIFPAQLHDIGAHLRFLAYRATELHLDLKETVIWGESAGAHLAMLAAFQQHDNEAMGTLGAPIDTPRIAYLVDWFGLADVRGPMGPFPMPGPTPEERLIGGSIAEHPEIAAAASPIDHAHVQLAGALIMHGRDDALIPIEHSERIAAALKAGGTPVTSYWLEETGHGWGGRSGAALEALELTEEWLRTQIAL
jgi:acetyl esterase/lipase